MLITSGFNFEGHEILKYHGVFVGNSALGTGFFSEFGAGISDFLGTESNRLNKKLDEARSNAMRSLEQAVSRTGANAIIGLDLDYTMFTGNLIGVIASGTAVTVKEKGEENLPQEDPSIKILPVMTFSKDDSLRACTMYFTKENEQSYFQLTVKDYTCNHQLSAVHFDAKIHTVFGSSFPVNDKGVALRETSSGYFVSSPQAIDIPWFEIELSESLELTINKYVSEGIKTPDTPNETSELSAGELMVIKREYGLDAVQRYSKSEQGWDCPCGGRETADYCCHCGRKYLDAIFDVRAFLEEAKLLSSVREINDAFLEKENKAGNAEYEKTKEVLKASMTIERLYGNAKSTAIEKIKAVINTSEEELMQ